MHIIWGTGGGNPPKGDPSKVSQTAFSNEKIKRKNAFFSIRIFVVFLDFGPLQYLQQKIKQ
jgi:hypothetical protein